MPYMTDREQEVLDMVMAGASNRQIGVGLGISHQTVKNHMTAILHKQGATSRVELMAGKATREQVDLSGWIYAITTEGFANDLAAGRGPRLVKIGSAIRVEDRARALQAACPFPLAVIGGKKSEDRRVEERAIHHGFRDRRSHGEWFLLSSEDIEATFDKLPQAVSEGPSDYTRCVMVG